MCLVSSRRAGVVGWCGGGVDEGCGYEWEGEEEQAEDEVADEAVSFAPGDARWPERERDPDSDERDAEEHPAESRRGVRDGHVDGPFGGGWNRKRVSANESDDSFDDEE